MLMSLAAQWAALEEHFKHHARLVDRFREAGRDAVVRMWLSQTNEHGTALSPCERDALIERYCELFGTWPSSATLPEFSLMPPLQSRRYSSATTQGTIRRSTTAAACSGTTCQRHRGRKLFT
jgi:hypothetical protein